MFENPEEKVKASFVLGKPDEVQKKAEKCGGEFYDFKYTKVENPLSMEEKKVLITRLMHEFQAFARKHKEMDLKTLQESFVEQANKKKDDKMVTFITKTHPTIATVFLMQRKVDQKHWDVLQKLIKTQEIERSNASEEIKIEANVQLHKDVLRKCGITKFDKPTA